MNQYLPCLVIVLSSILLTVVALETSNKTLSISYYFHKIILAKSFLQMYFTMNTLPLCGNTPITETTSTTS